jgi:hypothetical protein
MDVLELLSQEHDEAKKVFKKIEKSESPAERKRLWAELSAALTLHEEMEETLFYPPLKEVAQTEDIVLEGYQEHHVMDILIEELNALDVKHETWEPKFKVLMENTEHHIEEEEGELWPKVRKVWSLEKRKEVGRQMEEMKQKELAKQRKAA